MFLVPNAYCYFLNENKNVGGLFTNQIGPRFVKQHGVYRMPETLYALLYDWNSCF